MERIETDLTTGSISAAQSVCNTLSRNSDLTEDQRAALFYADAILYDLVGVLEESESDDSTENIIPIPAEVMSEDAMTQVINHVHGRAEEER